MKTEVFEVEGGFGYSIIDAEKSIHIEQLFKPGVSGFQAMTKDEAEQLAVEAVEAVALVESAEVTTAI